MTGSYERLCRCHEGRLRRLFGWLAGCRHPGVVRVHSEGDGYGDPYSWCATLSLPERRGDSSGVGVVGAVLRAPLPSEYRAAVAAAKDAGFASLRWERRRDGAVREVTRNSTAWEKQPAAPCAPRGDEAKR